MKKRTYKIDEQGRPTWLNRKAERYINGEKVVYKYDYKNDKLIQVGEVTGRVYYDPELIQRQRELEWDEQEKKRAIKHGDLTYLSYVSKFKTKLSRELSTEKFIAEIRKEQVGDGWRYYKYYINPESMPRGSDNRYRDSYTMSLYPLNERVPGSLGVEITEEEYERLSHGWHSYKINGENVSLYTPVPASLREYDE